MSGLGNLESPCPVCHRTSGDHTLREWAACLGEPTTDLPYEEVPRDTAAVAAAELRRRFGIDPDVIVADNVVVKALTIDGSTGPVTLRLPALLHEFGIGQPGAPPAPVATVLFAGGPDVVRQYGRLVRDSANGAVNAAARGR